MDNRRYPTHPYPGVGAIVVGSKGVLLARRDKSPGKDLWSFPGGGIELGETQEAAIIREVREETGVTCEVLSLLTTADLITADESGRIEYHYLLNHYLAKALTENTSPELPDGEVGWFHPDELPPDMADSRITKLIESARPSILEIMRIINNTEASPT